MLRNHGAGKGRDEAGAGALQGRALADYFWETDHGTDLRYLLFQGVPDQENTDARSAGALQSLLDDGFFPVAAADYQVCGFDRQRAADAIRRLHCAAANRKKIMPRLENAGRHSFFSASINRQRRIDYDKNRQTKLQNL